MNAIPAQTFASDIRDDNLSQAELEVLDVLKSLSPDYPEIINWYYTKVIPGVRFGTRKIIRLERANQLAALGIVKAEAGEKKICTVRVSPLYANKGLGLRVFDEAMEWLGTDKPHLTVSENKLPEFQKLFEYYGFKMTSTSNSLYLPNRIEYLFNETSNPWL